MIFRLGLCSISLRRMRRQIRQEPTSTATFQTLLEFTCNHRKTTQITTLPLSIQEKPLQYSTLSRMSKVRELAPIMVENPSSVASLQSAGSETGRMKIVDGLCGICSQLLDNLDMFIDKRDEEPPSSHHNSILELRKSAKDGCSLVGETGKSVRKASVKWKSGISSPVAATSTARTPIREPLVGFLLGFTKINIHHKDISVGLCVIQTTNSVIISGIQLSPVPNPGLCSYIPRN